MAAAAVVLPPVTPPDYHRIVSPTLTIPTNRLAPIPVGLLACQRDPLLRELESNIITCTLAQAAPQQKRAKKGEPAPAAAEPLLEVILHDTVIFPEGGGQPSDIGTLVAQNGQMFDVVEVRRTGGHAVHYVKVGERGAVDDALGVLAPGTTVRVALGEAGLARRLDHMSMHTSQHLLSAVLERSFDIPTLAWSLSTAPAPAYVEVPRPLTAEEIAAVQAECNRFVIEGRRVHVEVDELDAEFLKTYRSPSVGIPTDYTGGVKRIVVIDGVDSTLCCGTHPPTIHNLQLFLFPQTENLARANTSSARLYFLAGPRLLAYLGATHTQLTQAAGTLSCGAAIVPERVAQVIDDRKRMTNRAEDVERELAGMLGREMARQGAGTGNAVVLHRHRTDDAPNTLNFLGLVAAAFVAELASLSPPPPYLAVLTSSPSSQSAATSTTVFVVGSDEQRVKAIGDSLKAKLGVKGGGKGTRWSGKFTGVWLDSREGTVVRGVLDG